MDNKVGGTFTSQAYINILFDLQSTYGTGIQKNHLKNKIRSLKQNYVEFKDAFCEMSRFAWNWETKKFDAENDVWEALIQENPSAASLRGKCYHHWDQMNTLWSNSRAVGIKATTAQEHCSRLDAHFTTESNEMPFQSTNFPNSSRNHDLLCSPNLPNATSNTCMPDFSRSGPSTWSGKTKAKRRAAVELSLHSVCKKITSSLEHISRTIVESAEILANKAARPYESSAQLFKAVEELDLSEEYLLESYEFLSKNEKESNMSLGTPQQYKQAMLARIMRSRYLP